MNLPEHAMIEHGGLPTQQEQNRQAFLRYLPKRIADFERRILRYRFAGWDPKGMGVLAGDAQRLADASATYDLTDTRTALLALAHRVGEHTASMRAPEPKQVEGLFALLGAVLRSLPTMPAATPAAAPRLDAEASVAPDAIKPTPAPPSLGGCLTPPAEDVAAPAADPSHGAVTPTGPVETPTSAAEDSIGTPHPEANRQESLAPAEPTDASGCQVPAEVASTHCPSAPDALTAPATSAATDPASEPLDPAADAGSPAATTALATGALAAPGVASVDVPDLDAVGELESLGAAGMRRIFHLSDGNDFARALGDRLEADGHAVEQVEDIDELSELLTCMTPHMLLVDASHVARLAIVGALRRDAQQHSQPPRHIRMVVLAAHDDLDVRRAAHRAGADVVLFPPFDLDTVADRLEALYAPADAEPASVLIVDDQRADALFAQAVLERAGMHVRVEHDPLRVAQALASERTDLVLMDLHMPLANGVEVTMLLRADPQFARIPVVFLSGESDPDSRLEAINAGGDDFLFKPIRPRNLIEAVQDSVRRLHSSGARATEQGLV
ncbi:MAG: response regulator [Proteobacteria bacterium]|nr:response regulator [Pseudomonadota bacterium]